MLSIASIARCNRDDGPAILFLGDIRRPRLTVMPTHSPNTHGHVTPPAHSPSLPTYEGRRAALLTQHGKERVIAPRLHSSVGCLVERVGGYDTDLLGTFTRDIPRRGTQIEAAREKARLGMELSGHSIGLGSEGAFGADPMLGMLPWNIEILVWIDGERGFEVIGSAEGGAVYGHEHVADWAQVEAFARRWRFPGHRLVIRPERHDDPRMRKGVSSWRELRDAFRRAGRRSSHGEVFLETDARAFANPTRMRMIGRAARDLAAKLRSPCPSCGLPGFWKVDRIPGLPCARCGAPTTTTMADVWGCHACSRRLVRERQGATSADPAQCDLCNP